MATAKGGVLEEARPHAKGTDVGELSQFTLMRRRFMQSKLSIFGGIVLIILYIMAAIAPFLSPYPYDAIDSEGQWSNPTSIQMINGQPSVCPLTQTLDFRTYTWMYAEDCSQAVPVRFFVHSYPYNLFGIESDLHLFGVDQPAKIYLLGTDGLGRDLLSRVLEGSRISMTIGLVGVALSITIGSILGTTSGYLGGAADNLIQRIVELLQSMPTLPLWAALAVALPISTTVVQRYFLITIILSLVTWTGLARQVRGKVMGYRSLDYTLAARLAGASHKRIVLSHMLPNAVSHIIVVATLAVPANILGETALSFLGLGMLPPAVSWGVLLRDAQQLEVVRQHIWLLMPAAAVILAVTCWQFLGDGLRDAADPYS
jgi:peptide/nickel transport system permease protein